MEHYIEFAIWLKTLKKQPLFASGSIYVCPQIRGHSTIMWTEFCHSLPPPPLILST